MSSWYLLVVDTVSGTESWSDFDTNHHDPIGIESNPGLRLMREMYQSYSSNTEIIQLSVWHLES